MGNKIITSGADYSTNNVNSDFVYDFDVRSDHASAPVLTGNTVSFKNTGVSGNYETVGNTFAKNVSVTMPIASPVSVFAVGIAILSDGNYAYLYLDGTGVVNKFYKDGHLVGATTLYTMAGSKPNIAKGSPVTLVYSSDRVNISYTGYSQDLLFSNIPGFSTSMIGLLATGTATNSYTFIVN